MSDLTAPADPPPASSADDAVAPAPPMPVQSALYIAPDGRVSFGALFESLVPVARALDPAWTPLAPPADE